MSIDRFRQALQDANVQAFLRMIRQGESGQGDDAYRMLFGSTRAAPKLFDSFDDHPRVKTYETYDGQFIRNGKLDFTTAAGAYQIVASTWDSTVRSRIGQTDFSPANQDLAAVALIDYRKALDDVLAGRIDQAIEKCRAEWVSLPGAKVGDQPSQKHALALEVYRSAGGVLRPSTSPAPVEDRSTPVAPAPSQEKAIMAPIVGSLLVGLARNLFDAFTPLAREKLTKEMDRHVDNPQAAAQIAGAVIDSVKTITGQADAVAAVAAAKADPVLMQAVEASAVDTLAKLQPVLDQLFRIDQARWAQEEASREAASVRAIAERAAGSPDQDPYLTKSIVRMMVGVLVGLGLLALGLKYLDFDVGGIIGTLLTLVGFIGSTFRTRFDYRYGSSAGSAAKDVIVNELSRSKR